MAQPLMVRLSGVSYQFSPYVIRYFSSELVVTHVGREVKNTGNGQIRFYVYKGIGEWWINPLLNSGESYKFDIFPNEKVDRVAFLVATQGGAGNYNYRPEFWAKVDYVPIPSSLLLLAPGLAFLSILREE